MSLKEKHTVFKLTALASLVYLIHSQMLTTGWLIEALCISIFFILQLVVICFLTQSEKSMIVSILSFAVLIIVVATSTQYRFYDYNIELFELK